MNIHHRYAVTTVRILLGLIFIAFGAMAFFVKPDLTMYTGQARVAMDGLMALRFVMPMQMIALFVAGALLLVNRATPFALVIAAPFIISWWLFHAFVMLPGWPVGAVIGLLALYLASAWWSAYAPLFERVAIPKLK